MKREKYTVCSIIYFFFFLFSLAEAQNVYDFIPESSFYLKKSNVIGVDSVVCINLDTRPEKWNNMINRFKPYNIQLQRFSAIDGWKLDKNKSFHNKYCFHPLKYKLTNGEIGVYLSHLTLWKQALKQKLNTIWILEDDASIKRNPREVSNLIEHLNRLVPDWDILYTDSHFWNNLAFDPPSKRKKRIPEVAFQVKGFEVIDRAYPKISSDFSRFSKVTSISPFVKKIGGRWGLHSVIYSKKGIKKLVDHFSKLKIILPVDAEIFLTPNLKMYSTKTDIVGQDFKTNISDTRKHY